ncbi:MAG TPA: benzoate-CoA ligase family protein [Pyrinomonadaceae bacterium]|nr:benzoate-CoA ligase family protein [Pyrinomonadaceae bacterium]
MNLVEYVFSTTRASGVEARTAVACGGRQLSYSQLLVAVRRFGGALRSLGVRRGERVAIVSADCTEFVAAFLGTAAVGSVAVPASTLATPAELEYVLSHCGARAVVVTGDQLDKLRSIRGSLPRLETVLLVGSQEAKAGSGEADDGVLNFDEAASGVLGFDEAVGAACEAEIEDVDDETPAFILYTSGSTGRPKGATHVHRSLPYTVETYCKRVLRVSHEDRLFSSSRLFFAYGLGNSLSFPLSSGATSILCRERPTPQTIAEVFEREKPSIFFAVPAVFRALLEHCARSGELKTGSIRFCVSAGERLPERIYREWRALTGLDILDGIGSTEMLHMFFSNTRERIKPGSSGEAVPGYEARLVDREGREVEGAGDLFVKGRSAAVGYWNEPEKTADAMRGGWIRTGDIYRRDAEGFYWFEGRGDDLFKVKGMWVFPSEIEDALLSHPEVQEAAVVPRSDADGFNSVVAFVIVKSDSKGDAALSEKLKAHLSMTLPPHKRPSEFRFAKSLPRTATGKLQRFKLREELNATPNT